ncbi:MAG: DUF2752 domain-containing protein [Candidatus Omnitrophica bacterium]|nr:DUF2752 domain-containing protein [Candidatus Omnitrophota bacterium]
MESLLSRNRPAGFLLECVSLSTPRGRAAVFGCVLVFLLSPGPAHPGLPCLIKKIFGYCPACGTVRALAFFLKGRFAESLACNLNVIVTAPLFCGLFLLDLGRIVMKHKNEQARRRNGRAV